MMSRHDSKKCSSVFSFHPKAFNSSSGNIHPSLVSHSSVYDDYSYREELGETRANVKKLTEFYTFTSHTPVR